MQTIKNTSFAILVSVFLTRSSEATEHSPLSLPPLSSEALTQTATQCRTAIDQLWEARRNLKAEQLRDFQIAIGHASKNCDDLQEIYKQLSQAAQLKQEYEKTLQIAQSLVSKPESVPTP